MKPVLDSKGFQLSNTVEVSKYIKSGGVGVMATDTLYGIVGSAYDTEVVERIYRIKVRQPDKPMIILISDYADLEQFKIKLDDRLKRSLENVWPGAVSVILPCPSDHFAHLHRGTKTLAFRLPAKQALRQLVLATGPLVAPSANPESLPPAATIAQAWSYFGSTVDFYKRGRVSGKSSQLVKFQDNQMVILRP